LMATKRLPNRFAPLVAAGIVGLSLLMLLIGPRSAGTTWQITNWSSLAILTPSLALQANRAGRLLGSATVAAVLGAMLVTLKRSDQSEPQEQPTTWVLGLVVLTAGLLTLLPANLLTLALAWTILDSALAAAWLLAPDKREGQRQTAALLSWGAGAASTLLLWAAAIPLHAEFASQEINSLAVREGWMGTALILAVLLRLAPFPFHLGHPLLESGRSDRPASRMTRQLVPLAAGAWLLAQIASWDAMPTLAFQVISALLLTGLVGSALLVWLPSEDQRAIRWIISGQAGMVALAGLWAGPEAALAEGMTLILAGALLTLYVSLEHSPAESKIATGLGIIALTGLPLTWGGDGRFPLYQAWLDDGWGLYLFLAAGAYLLLLGAAGKSLLKPITAPADRDQRIFCGAGLGVLALGLLLRGSPIPAGGFVVWLAILLPLVVGALLAWEADSLRPIQDDIEPWLSPALSLDWLRRLGSQVGGAAGRGIHAVQAVLEGEGALLWVLVVLALGWLLTGR